LDDVQAEMISPRIGAKHQRKIVRENARPMTPFVVAFCR
jgi:hypothetical protein